MISLLYSTEKQELIKIKSSSIHSKSYAHTSKILNIEPRYIKDRLRDVYVIDNNNITKLLSNTPFPNYIDNHIILWDNKFIINIDIINWETLNIIMATSGSPNMKESYSLILKENILIKQNMMYLSVQLQSISAKIAEFKEISSYRYFDIKLFTKILKRKKIKYSILGNRVILKFKDIRIGNKKEGYIIYNGIEVYISQWNSIDGFILEFNNFSYTSFWNIKDVVLHPYLQCPYYLNIPYLDLSYESYIDYIYRIIIGIDYKPNTGLSSISNIITEYNRYRRIWNGIKDPRSNHTYYKDIFNRKDNNKLD